MKILSDHLFYDLLHAPLSDLQKQFGSQLRRLEHYRIDGNDEPYTYFARYENRPLDPFSERRNL